MKEVKFPIIAIGRRKTTTAKVIVKPGKGRIIINGKPFEDYFGNHFLHKSRIKEVLSHIKEIDKYNIIARTNGGGITGNADAIRLGIARAFVEIYPEYKPIFKEKKFLTRDPRMVERKKPGQPKARKKFQWTKR